MNKIKKYFIISCVIAIIFGTLQHFDYDCSNNNIIVGLLSPVNESVWEHLKLVFVPIVIFAIITKVIYKPKNIMIATSIATIISSTVILIIHYTFIRVNIESITVDILTYILAIMLAFFIIFIIYNNNFLIKYEWLGYIILLTLFVIFIIFTFFPPKLPIFLDKLLNDYGILHS